MDVHNFYIHESNIENLSEKITLVPNLCLEQEKYYQIVCGLSVVINTDDNKIIGQFNLMGGCVKLNLIGNGFKLETIIKDKDFDVYVHDNGISLEINDDKFCITIKPAEDYAINIEGIVETKITSFLLK
jgi:hypothetical protein